MIQRLFEAILAPVFALVAHLMQQLFLAPFRALFGAGEDEEPDEDEPPEDEEEAQAALPPGESPKQLEDEAP